MQAAQQQRTKGHYFERERLFILIDEADGAANNGCMACGVFCSEEHNIDAIFT